jgi:formate hydrogenlyase subunit 3/multisubunit Na+/H+ antiporter MnhD subunit
VTPTTMPELGWLGTLGMLLFIGAMVATIVLYHIWMGRRLEADQKREGDRPSAVPVSKRWLRYPVLTLLIMALAIVIIATVLVERIWRP